MRVRYGKPIKAKSLLGKANIPFSYTAANVTFYPLTTGTFHYYADPSVVLNIKYVNRQANHKYFLFLNTDIVYSWSHFGIWDTYNTGYEGNRTPPIKDGNNYYALISPTTSATNGVPSFQFGVTQNLPAIANYALIIDLTEIGLDNLTAQEFYNKYHQYFPLIATGEEITIDDKAGQISIAKISDIYEELEYIESDGNQYIYKSDWNKAVNGSLEVKYKVTSSTTNTSYFSTIESDQSGGQAYSLGFTTNNHLQLRWNQVQDFYINYVANNILEVGRTETVDTTLKAYSIFSHSQDGIKWSGRCYYCWLKLDGKYLFNFVPVLRKSDNKPGMLDLVENKFYTNQGTSEFTYKTKQTIPAIYKPLEYISVINNSVNGYTNGFNTNFTWADIDRIDVDLSVINYSTGHSTVQNNNIIVKSGTSATSLAPYINLVKTNANPQFSSLDSFGWSRPYSAVELLTSHKTISFNAVSSSTNKIVFGCWQDAAYSASNNFYRITLSKNNVLVADFIPCERINDNVLGFYEVVGKQFYINQGTGTFLKGNNVNNTISCKVAGGSSDIYYEYNQLVKNGNFIDSSDWSNTWGTTKAVSDNIMTLTATSLDQYDFAIYQNIGDLKANDKYIILFDAKTNSSSNKTINIYLTAGYVSQGETLLPNVWNSIGKIFSYSTDKTNVTAHFGKIGGLSGLWANGDIIYFKNINIINLTTWFGAGKEPATVEEFKEKFIKEYYGFCPTPIKLTRYQIEALPTYGYGYNQLSQNNQWYSSPYDSNGIKVVNNKDGSFTLTGTATDNNWVGFGSSTFILEPGRKYIGLGFDEVKPYGTSCFGYIDSPYIEFRGDKLFTVSSASSTNQALWLYVKSGTAVTSPVTIYPQIIDLTDWYGAGNEPMTIEEFKATFPNKYYPYSKKRLLNKYMINKLIN